MQFQKKAIFFAAPGDMGVARDYVIAAVNRRIQELSKEGEFQTYCWDDEVYPNPALTWQQSIASPLDRNCVLTVVLWGERIGKPLLALSDLDEDRLNSLNERSDAQPESVAATWLVDVESADPSRIPLTGTVLEFLEAMEATRLNSAGLAVYVKGEEKLLKRLGAPDRPFGLREHYDSLKDSSGYISEGIRRDYDDQLRLFAKLYDRAAELSKPWEHFTTKEDLAERVCKRMSTLLTGTTPSARNVSFPGLAALRADRNSLFLGRASEIEDAFGDLAAATAKKAKSRPLAIVHGPTGAGKSSFARRGIGGELLRRGGRVNVCEFVVSNYLNPSLEGPLGQGADQPFQTGAKTPLAELLGELAQSLNDENLSRNLVALGHAPTVEQAIDFLRNALKQSRPGWDRVVLVLDQAELMLKRFSHRTPSGQLVESTQLLEGWDEVVAFVDRLSRTHGKAGLARQHEGLEPFWVILTAPSDPTHSKEKRPLHAEDRRKLRQIADADSAPRSKAEMLVWSTALQKAIRDGGDLVDINIEPLGRGDVDSILRRGFETVGLPTVDAQLAKQISDEYDRLLQSRHGSPMPLLGLYLSRLAEAGEKLIRKRNAEVRKQDPRESITARDLVIGRDYAAAEGVSGLAETLKKLADQAIRNFIIARFETFENYEMRASSNWNEEYPVAGVSALSPDDVRVLLARILRRAVRVTQEDDTENGTRTFAKTLATAKIGGAELPLMQAFVDQRLAYQSQLFHYRFMHQGLIEWWEPARFWFERERDHLETESEFKTHCINAASYGVALSPALAIRVARLIAAQTEEEAFLSQSDREKFYDQLTPIVATLTAIERSQIVRAAATARDDDLSNRILAPLQDHDLITWLHMGEDGASPPLLLHALRCGHLTTYRKLRDAGAATRIRDRRDTTLVHELAWRCDAKELKSVLEEHSPEQRADMVNEVMLSTRIGPLFMAVSKATQYADPQSADAAIFPTIKVLREAEADPHATNEFDRTILHQAARHGLTSVVKLLARDASLKGLLTMKNDDGQAPLHLAAYYGHEACVEELLRNMSRDDVDSRDMDRSGKLVGRTALWSAAQAGRSSVVLLLLKAGADPNIFHGGRPLLHVAARSGDGRTVRLLLDGGADIGAKDDQDQDLAIHEAAAEGHDIIVQMLKDRMIAVGIDPWQGNAYDKTALHVAAEFGRLAVAMKIGPADPKILNLPDDENRTAFSAAVRRAAKERDPNGGAAAIAKRLLGRGANPLIADIRGRIPLHYAAGSDGLGSIVDLLLSKPSAAEQVIAKNEFGETAMHEAAGFGDVYNLSALSKAGASTAALNHEERIPLHVAAIRGREDTAGWLLEHADTRSGPPPYLRKDRAGRTALHFAVASASLSTVNLLLEAGANLLARDSENDQFPSDYAVRNDDKIIIQTLIGRIKSPGTTKLVLNSGLRTAAQGANAHMVEWFLQQGGQPNAADAWGSKPLHLVLRQRPESAEHLEVVRRLVASGADINAVDGFGISGIAIARHWKDPALFAVLGMMADAANPAGDTASSGHRPQADWQKKKLMSCWEAASTGARAELSLLLDADVHVDTPDCVFERPLHHACRARDIDTVKMLVHRGADVGAESHRGETPFHVAAESGWVDGIRAMLAAPSKPIAPPVDRTSLQWTPLHVACSAADVSDEACSAMFDLFAGSRWTTESRDRRGYRPRDYAAFRNRQISEADRMRSVWQVVLGFGTKNRKKR